MKVRLGFVANSSSSSFLVGFSRIPKTEDELREMMFGDQKGTNVIYGYDEYAWSVEGIVKRVFRDLQNAQPLTESEQIIEVISSGSYPGGRRELFREHCDAVLAEYLQAYPGASKQDLHQDEEWREKYWAAYHEDFDEDQRLEKECAEKYWDAEKYRFEGRFIYRFTYSDNSGESAFEHGGIFENLPHLVISHH